jgi:hypothetical protein
VEIRLKKEVTLILAEKGAQILGIKSRAKAPID